MKTKRIVFASALVALLAVGCSREREEYYNGRARAAADVAKGVLRVASAPDAVQPPPWGLEYALLLETNYGIGANYVSLPIDPRAAEAWARGYNEIAQPEIERRFGTNVLKRTTAEARRLYEAKRVKSGP